MTDPNSGPSLLPIIPEPVWLFVAKFLGAVAGSAVSIAYMLPKDKREAALRFAIGLTAGLIFGTSVGVKLADEIGVADRITSFEMTLSGAALASVCAWWGLGILSRIANRAIK